MTVKEVVSHIREKKPDIAVFGEGITDYWYRVNLRGKAQEGDFDVWRCDTPVTRMVGGASAVWRNVETLMPEVPVFRIEVRGTEKFRFWDTSTERIVFRYDKDSSGAGDSWEMVSPQRNIIISDYGKGMFSWPVLRTLSDCHSDSRVIFSPHITNCKSWTPSDMNDRMREWTWVVNRAEFDVLCRARFGLASAKQVIVTDGDDRVVLAEKKRFSVRRVEVSHTVAIGDVFLASFSAAYFSDPTLGESIEFAIAVCENVLKAKRFGTCQIQEEDLK